MEDFKRSHPAHDATKRNLTPRSDHRNREQIQIAYQSILALLEREDVFRFTRPRMNLLIDMLDPLSDDVPLSDAHSRAKDARWDDSFLGHTPMNYIGNVLRRRKDIEKVDRQFFEDRCIPRPLQTGMRKDLKKKFKALDEDIDVYLKQLDGYEVTLADGKREIGQLHMVQALELVRKSWVALEEGRIGAAEEFARIALERDPNCGEAYRMLAWRQKKVGREEFALNK